MATLSTTFGGFSTRVFAIPAQSGNGFKDRGSPLRDGVPIGPSSTQFWPYSVFLAGGGQRTTNKSYHCLPGPWENVHDRYLGLRFMISGEVHYGWARLADNCHKGYNILRLAGYAYETTPNQSLKAGKKKGELDESPIGTVDPAPLSERVPMPATLWMLAGGAPALNAGRPE